MDVVLVAGLWLPSSIWADVGTELSRLGHRPLPVDLPGVDRSPGVATLDEQVDAVLAAIDASDRPMVVGHSAACTLAWIAADRRPDAIGGVVMIGGFPGADGQAYADFFELVGGVMPFPGWDSFEGPDSDDLDASARDRIAAAAVPVAEGVARGVVRLGDERRFDVPVVLVCPEFGPDDARGWIAGGDVPELARASDVSYVDIDSGHWPMISRPVELAAILAAAPRWRDGPT